MFGRQQNWLFATWLSALLLAMAGNPAAGQGKFAPAGKGFDLGGGFDVFAPVAEEGELVTITARFTAATADSPALIAITAQVADGYHIYSVTQPKGGPQPTRLGINESSGVRQLGRWVPDPEPESHIDQEIWQGLSIEEHAGEVTWRAPIELPAGADPATFKISGTVDAQACTAMACNPVKTTFVAELAPPGSIEPIVTAQATAAGESNASATQAGSTPASDGTVAAPLDVAALAPILGAAFLGGLILNLMPCVLPVIGLKVLSFAEQAGHDRGRVLAMNLAYTAGLMSVFMLLAALAAFAGYGWGELYTRADFKIGMVIFVFAMALSFLGVWEIPLPGFAGGKGANELQQKEGFSGAFFKGAFTTILATPCSGPFLGPVFGFLIARPPSVTFLVFGAIGLGMASPYLVIGAFPSLVKALPKPGAWMETFKQLMGFVLLGTVVYLFSLVSEEQRLPVLTTLVAVGFGCWWIGATPITASGAKRKLSWIGGITTAVAVGVAAFVLMRPSEHELDWTPFSPAALAATQAEGKTVLVDFTADWCPTCHVNSRVAINTEQVKQVVEANGVTPLLADWSDENETIERTLESLGSRSIPFLAIFPANRPDDPILLPDLITEGQLLAALAEAGAVEANPAATGEMPTIEIGEAATGGTFR